MRIMQQSGNAQGRDLGSWFQNIQQGVVKRPRLQRFEIWDRDRITIFLNPIVSSFPEGGALAQEVGDQRRFEPSYISVVETHHMHKLWATGELAEEAVV